MFSVWVRNHYKEFNNDDIQEAQSSLGIQRIRYSTKMLVFFGGTKFQNGFNNGRIHLDCVALKKAV